MSDQDQIYRLSDGPKFGWRIPRLALFCGCKKGHRVGALFWVCVRRCPTFPPGLGSIIGAGRLSFRVRDGSGRFPVAVAAVTLCSWFGGGVGVVLVVVAVLVSFRPVSASSLSALLRV